VARSRRVGREPLRLRGSPSRLSAVLPLPQSADPSAIDVDLPQVASADATLQELDEGTARLSLAVARTTPPGTYEGTVRVGDEQQAVVLEVEPRVHLQVDPRRLYFRAAPGSTVEADLVVTNLGNVPCALPDVDAFGLFDTGGLDRAIGRAFSGEPADGERRLDVLVDAAAEGWGGLVRMKVAGGETEIAAGEARAVQVALSIPEGLEPGRLYWGTWLLYNVNYVVRVEAIAPTRRREEPR
jgi:hypothetical protein